MKEFSSRSDLMNFILNKSEQIESGCIEWKACKSKKGYGQLRKNKKTYLAHRLSFYAATGIDPVDKLVCHQCDNPSCVNPDHLWLGTNADNMIDMKIKGRKKKNHCINGHDFSGLNVGINKSDKRYCKQCAKDRSALRYKTNEAVRSRLAEYSKKRFQEKVKTGEYEHMKIEKRLKRVASLPTHCKNGHEYTPENTYIAKGRSGRNCRKCRNDYAKKFRGK